jgi:hypothetical protein
LGDVVVVVVGSCRVVDEVTVGVVDVDEAAVVEEALPVHAPTTTRRTAKHQPRDSTR